MTEKDLAVVVRGLAPVIREYVAAGIATGLGVVVDRVKVLEDRPPVAGPAGPEGKPGPVGERGPVGADGAPGRDGRDGLPGVQGEKGLDGLHGKDGAPGTDGAPGLNGKDGTAGLTYCGVYQEGTLYVRGDLVTWGGSTWHCNEEAPPSKPGEASKAWTLIVKRGRDGKDGTVGPEGKPGRDGKDWKGQS